MISESEKIRFDEVCRKALLREKNPAGIGTYKEKALHWTLKHFICDDESCHEIKVFHDLEDEEKGGRESSHVADVLLDCDIFEIQTGSLYPLVDKIKAYLELTEYNVTVVCPLAARKWVSWMDADSGEVLERNRSPKKQTEGSLLPELFWMIPYLNNRRFRVRAMLLEIEEFRLKNGWGNGGKRGSERYERIPAALVDVYEFNTPADYLHLLPKGLPARFTAKEFGAAAKLRGRKVYSALKVFIELGLVCESGKIGRATAYEIK